MASSPTEPRATDHRFRGFDGADLAWHELGKGRPVVMIHGFMSDAQTNWVRFGHAAKIAEHGFRVIMPDLRGHGSSARPHGPAAYPPDALTQDAFALVEQLGLGDDYDLVGYSLGARTMGRMLALGARPKRLVFSGMGLEGLTHANRRADHFRRILDGLGTYEKGSPAWMVEAFLKTTKGDPVALRLVIETFVDTPLEVVEGITVPTLVLCGDEDTDNGSAPELAAAIPGAKLVQTPGGHMSAVTKPELGEALAAFLAVT